jgi:hypothetical protein
VLFARSQFTFSSFVLSVQALFMISDSDGVIF